MSAPRVNLSPALACDVAGGGCCNVQGERYLVSHDHGDGRGPRPVERRVLCELHKPRIAQWSGLGYTLTAEGRT